MLNPFTVVRARGDRQRSTAGRVWCGDPQLYGETARRGEAHRRGEGEFLDLVVAEFFACGEGQLQQGGTGHDDGTVDRVVDQPWVGSGVQPGCQQGAFLTGQFDRGVQQGCAGPPGVGAVQVVGQKRWCWKG